MYHINSGFINFITGVFCDIRFLIMQAYARLILFLFLPVFIFGQGYYNQENFGNRSILLGGNVTGSVDDLGLTYYNPARLALIEDPVFSINAKAYQFSSVTLKNPFGRESKLSDSRFEGVPSLVSGTFKIEKWPKHHFAYAFLSRQRARIGVNVSRDLSEGDLIDENEDLDRFVGDFKLDNTRTDEWFGMTWGMKIKDNLSVGVSAFVSIFNSKAIYDLGLATLGEASGVDLFSSKVKYGQTSYGLFLKGGLAWQLEKFELGLNIDAPFVDIINSGKFEYQRFLSGTSNGQDEFIYFNLKDLKARRKEPLAISVGAGIPVKKHKIHVKADWHGKVSEYDRLVIPSQEEDGENFFFKEELRSVINFGAGIEFYVNDHMNLYGSISTDFSPVKSNASIFDLIENESDANFDADYFHYAFGLDFKLKKVELVVGATYSTGSAEFGEPIRFPGDEFPTDENPSHVTATRWRFVVGLEIPLFGYELEFK